MNDRTRRTDTASLVVPASARAVYSALTDAGALEAWLPPTGMTGEVHELDLRPGGRFHMTLWYSPVLGQVGKTTEDADVVDARIAELVPDQRVVWLVRFDSDDPAFEGVMRMSWQLAAVPGGTRVDVVAEDVPPGIAEAEHLTGLRSSLANLAAYMQAHPA